MGEALAVLWSHQNSAWFPFPVVSLGPCGWKSGDPSPLSCWDFLAMPLWFLPGEALALV